MLRPRASFAAACVALGLATLHARAARADGADECNPAYEAADALVRAGGDDLLTAREKLLACARPVCKPWMVKECTKSLSDLEARIPTVVFSAKDASGADLVDVAVTSADRTLAERLDGRAIDLGPGERSFVFVATDGRRATVRAVIKEGEKAQRVTATLEPLASAPPAVPPPPVAPGPATGPVPPPETSSPAAEAPSKPVLGFAALGVGALGIGVGAVFGVLALDTTGTVNDHCHAERCDPTGLEASSAARSFATVSTVGFVVGLVAAAGGAYLVLSAPKRSKAQAAIGAGPRSLSFTGRW
jgi:hypothetical protein